MDINIRVSKPKSLKKAGNYGFNLYCEFDGFKILINGFRLMSGYIYPPALKFGPGQFYGVALLDNDLMGEIYTALRYDYGMELKPVEKAIGPCLYTDTKGEKFLTEMA